ncbi:bifunctional phosphoglucose/phosphomannose isomerase [Patescibacteria group bacterium AH-259-L05]|nr:bifunctional phosphoglucose/phosphomannose isomerase [Patescibacteria group bacterium AH-259-L05]
MYELINLKFAIMSTLDDINKIKQLDTSGMADFIADLPNQILKAYKQSQKIKLPKNFKNISNIVACGMGGSAIGGDVVKALIDNQLSLPFIINRSYQLSQTVNKNSLVFLVSFSGNTQETLSCAKVAIQKKAHIFVITSGGKLLVLAQEKKIPLFTFSYKGPPRASLGYLFIPILITLEKLGLVNLDAFNITESIEKLKKFNQLFYPETPSEKNIAKYLAYFIFDHLPIIIAPEELNGIARRFKTQMAENAKTFSFFETAPEIFHNSIESQFPWRLKDDIVFLILSPLSSRASRGKTREEMSSRAQSREEKFITVFKKLLDKENIRWEAIPASGDNVFLNILSFILAGDWISFYLSILNETDPTPVKKIQWLKRQIKQ